MSKLRNIALIVLMTAAGSAHAQFLPEPVQYVITPEVPGPGQVVTIEAQGVGAFIGDSTITWQQDGKATKSGVGEHTYTFITGPVGSVTNLRVDIKSNGSGSFTKTFVFRPSTVNLVWEANTSAPPLYGGKTLYSAGSPLKVAAFPIVVINGSRVASQSLSYQWTRNGEPMPAQSGTGRSTLSFAGDQLQPSENIDVDVYFGSNLVARGSTSIPVTQPHVLLYERDSLRGTLYDTALPSRIALTGKEITIVGQPYNFSRAALAGGAVQYSWLLNGEEISGPDSARGVLTLRQTGDGEGSAMLAVTLQNNSVDQLIQSAQTVLDILFGQNSGGSLFGL